MAVFDTGNIAPQKPGLSLDVTLTEIPGFSQFTKPLTYKHPLRVTYGTARLKVPSGKRRPSSTEGPGPQFNEHKCYWKDTAEVFPPILICVTLPPSTSTSEACAFPGS